MDSKRSIKKDRPLKKKLWHLHDTADRIGIVHGLSETMDDEKEKDRIEKNKIIKNYLLV